MTPPELEEKLRKDWKSRMDEHYTRNMKEEDAISRWTQEARTAVENTLLMIPWEAVTNRRGEIVLKWDIPFTDSAYWLLVMRQPENAHDEYILFKYESVKLTFPWEKHTAISAEKLLELANDQFNETMAGVYLQSTATYRVSLKVNGRSSLSVFHK